MRPRPTFAETCGICGNDRYFWTSKTGYRVCMSCSGPDPLAALELLARRAVGTHAVQAVQRWRTEVSTPSTEALEVP